MKHRSSPLPHTLVIASLLAGVAGWSGTASAAPYVPASDDAVVQRLPLRLSRDEREQQRKLRDAPRDAVLAEASAREALQRARRSGDPRELGRAQAALAAWWTDAAPPPALRLLRASVLQSQHRFDLALKDLDSLIDGRDSLIDGRDSLVGGQGLLVDARASQGERRDASAETRNGDAAVKAQALLTRAGVHQVRGDLAAATRDCEVLLAMSSSVGGAASRDPGAARDANASRTDASVELTARACLADLMSLQGRSDAAAAAITDLQRRAPRDPWVALVGAGIAQRRGDAAATEAGLRRAAIASPDAYTLAALSDVYLETGRPQQALTTASFAAAADSDALLLRRAIAMTRSKSPEAKAAAQAFRERQVLARERGERHAREETLFALDVEGDAKHAWRLAQINWQEQKEPIDALLMVRAAMAAGQRGAAKLFVAERKAAGWHDVRLDDALKETS